AIEQFQIAGATLGYDQRFRALENMGRIYLKLGDTANAEKSFKQALQANRDSYISMLELAEIFYLNQQFPAATQMYQQFVRGVGQKNQGAPHHAQTVDTFVSPPGTAGSNKIFQQ